MNKNTIHHPTYSTEPAVASCRDGEFGGRAGLRRVLSQFGLHANDAQETELFELICRSRLQKQHANC
ncbi:MAG: hypothetical protein ACYSU8_05630 [Planctomycetota bacterium]|jgi:hypothetical protein